MRERNLTKNNKIKKEITLLNKYLNKLLFFFKMILKFFFIVSVIFIYIFAK